MEDTEKLQLILVDHAKKETDDETDLLLDALPVDTPAAMPQKANELPLAPDGEETCPERPPEPRANETTRNNEMGSCLQHSRSQNDPKPGESHTHTSSLNTKDGSFVTSTECSDSIVVDQDIDSDSEGQSGDIQISQEISWEIDLERLEVLDKVLGEGEFGIVHKGRYAGKDGKITDVAVKQLKGTTQIPPPLHQANSTLMKMIVNPFLTFIFFIIIIVR